MSGPDEMHLVDVDALVGSRVGLVGVEVMDAARDLTGRGILEAGDADMVDVEEDTDAAGEQAREPKS